MTLPRRDLLALSGMALAGTTLTPSAIRAQSPKRPSGTYVAVWDGALKNYGPNLGYDYGGRLMAAWLDR